MQSVEHVVVGIIAEVLGRSRKNIKTDRAIEKELGADSFDIMEIIMQIEDRFEKEIPDKEIEKWITVGDIANYIISVNRRSAL